MKKVISIILIVIMSLTACSTGTDTVKVEILPEGTELSGTLNIWSDITGHEYMGIDPLIKQFTELHPNVEIIVNDGNDFSSLDGDIVYEQLAENLKVKMLSGDAPDLIFTQRDTVTDFVPSGLVRNLNEYIESDPTFIEEDFYMNVLKTGEINGGLYAITDTFFLNFIRLKKDVLEAAGVDPDTVETVDYKFIYDTYNKAMASGEVPELTHISYSGKVFGYVEELATCFDRENMTANFITDEFVNYLETTNKYNAPDNRIVMDFYSYSEVHGQIDYPYMISSSSAYDLDAKWLIREDENYTKALPVVTSTGEFALGRAGGMSIPTQAQNAQLAWEFIKYCIYEFENEEQLSNLSGHLPINKNNMEKYIEEQLSSLTEDEKTNYMAYINETLKLPLRGYLPSDELSNALFYLQEDFYNGLMTAEECAKAMQDRVDIYLAEIA